MPTTIGAYEAKTHLPRLLDEVEAGATVTITQHGREVARLPVDAPTAPPMSLPPRARPVAVLALGRQSVTAMKEEGR